MGIGFPTYVSIGLSDHSKASMEAFEHAMLASPEVAECHVVTGVTEYSLRVETVDIEAYKRFHAEVLGTLPQVTSISSSVVMNSPKDERV